MGGTVLRVPLQSFRRCPGPNRGCPGSPDCSRHPSAATGWAAVTSRNAIQPAILSRERPRGKHRAAKEHRPQKRQVSLAPSGCGHPPSRRAPEEEAPRPSAASRPEGTDKMAAARAPRIQTPGAGRGRRSPGGVHCACAPRFKMADSAELKVKAQLEAPRLPPRPLSAPAPGRFGEQRGPRRGGGGGAFEAAGSALARRRGRTEEGALP